MSISADRSEKKCLKMFFLITDFFIWNKANSQQHTSHLSNLPKFRENEPTYIIKVILFLNILPQKWHFFKYNWSLCYSYFHGSFCSRTFKANEVKDEMMKFNLLIRRYIELYKWIKSRARKYSKTPFMRRMSSISEQKLNYTFKTKR